MITFKSGDMFDGSYDVMVNTVNCVGVMGKGVALEFKSRFPEMFDAYEEACATGEVSPGVLHVWDAPFGPSSTCRPSDIGGTAPVTTT
jgi:O-acetyl-ADP-ribose deacetylase (regulator of RNase III)